MRIFLIGFMGTGKTTLGKALALHLGITFYDLDQLIEQRYMKSITDLFSKYGEDGFRELEYKILHEAGEFENVVIACGGGTPLYYDNMDYMNRNGDTIYLKSSIETLIRRLEEDGAKRPLIAEKSGSQLKDFIVELLAKREPYYLKARYSIKGDRLEDKKQIAESVREIEKLLNKKLD